MLIHYTASGGFANLRLVYSADTTKLSQELTQELERLITQTNFFALAEQPAISAAGGPPDGMHYEISVQGDGEQRSLHYSDITVPEQLRPLLERLQELALESRKS